MPVLVLLGLVVGGIGSIAAILHLLGLSKRKSFATPQDASAIWETEFPDDPARHVTLSQDHHAALIDTRAGGRGIVWPMGADATARYLNRAKFKQTRSGLHIHFPDFTAPRITLQLNADEAAKWAKTGGTTP